MEPTLGNIIRTARKRQQLTQIELAARLQIDSDTLSRWERGLAFPRLAREMAALETVLGVQMINRSSGNSAIGVLIRDARKARGWLQADLAEKLGVAEKTVSKWEIGTHAPSRYLTQLEAMLGIQLSSEPPVELKPTAMAALSHREFLTLMSRVFAEAARRIPSGEPGDPDDATSLFEPDGDDGVVDPADGQIPITLSQAVAEGWGVTRFSDVPPPPAAPWTTSNKAG